MKKNKFKSLLFLAFLLTFLEAHSRFVWINFSYNKLATFFYDPGTLTESRQFRTIWILANYVQSTRSGAYSVLVRQKFDCRSAKYKILRLRSYSLKNGKGPIINNYSGQKDWKTIVAGTPDSDLMKIICLK